MFIKFKNIHIEGFQSIEIADIDLENQGVVLVKGINEYEEYSSSNGSGKSSIFESILFAIYGKTSSGITDPSNRYISSGCLVKLIFLIDSCQYTIIRSIKHNIHKTCLKLFKGDEEISGRNKTDTEKMIKSDIIPFNQDIFLSTIFLSQGFSGRLSTLQPSGRKERIELLTDTSSQIDMFRDKMMFVKSSYNELYDQLQRDISYDNGKISNIESMISKLTEDINRAEISKPEYNSDQINKLINKFETLLSDLNKSSEDINNDILKLRDNKSSLYSKLDIDNNNKLSISNVLENKDKICPTCGQVIEHNKLSEEFIKSKNIELENINNRINQYNSELRSTTASINTKKSELVCIKEKISKCNSKLTELRSKLVELTKYRDTDKDKENIDRLNNEIFEIKESLKVKENNSIEYDTIRSVANHCISLISKQFRGYMLEEIVEFMNSRLYEYSSMLFSNKDDIISLSIDSSKLDIYLNSAIYDTLSGGEKKKVDIALVLTQRDLAMNISGMSCNLLVLDEVMENMDETATNLTLELLTRASSDIESMFIISHNNYTMPFDSIITVVKSKNRVSKVEFS